MYVSSRQGYKPPVKSTGKVKEYTHFASLKYCNGAETSYIRPTASQITEPHREQWWQRHYGQCLYIRCGEQCAQRCKWYVSSTKWQGWRKDGAYQYIL